MLEVTKACFCTTHTNNLYLLNTYVSCVPKKNTWYLFEGDFTAPSGNSSICELRTHLFTKKDADESISPLKLL